MVEAKEAQEKKNQEEEKSLQERVIAFMESRYAHTVMETLGIRVEAYDPSRVVVAVDVSERLFQPAGVVHGGIYVLLAETAASIAAVLAVDASKETVMGMEINANHLRPVTEGTIRAISSLLHQGRTTLVYHIDIRDEKDRLIAVSRCTMARRPL